MKKIIIERYPHVNPNFAKTTLDAAFVVVIND